MKKTTFILVAILLFTSSIFASTEETPNHYRSSGYDGNSFNYVVGNVNFMVYQDGEFDFFIAHDGFTADFDFGAVNITYNSGYNYDGYAHEWTFYKLETDKGGLWMRWLGESNGFYSMRVTVEWIGSDDKSERLFH